MRWLCPSLALAYLAAAVALLGPDHPLASAFLLRVPLVFGLLLVLLPCHCTRLAPSLLENLAEQGSAFQLIAVTFAAAAAGMAAVRMFAAAALNLEPRFFLGAGAEQAARLEALPFWAFAGVALLLALPTVVWVFARSRAAWSLWAFIGSAAMVLGFFGVYDFLVRNDYFGWLARMLGGWLSEAPPGLRLGYLAGERLEARHLELLVFWLLAFALYLVGFWAFRPRRSFHTPALFFILQLAVHAGLFLGGAAFFLDYYRVPVSLVFVGSSLFGFFLWRLDHVYKLTSLEPAERMPTPDDTASALRARLERQGAGPKTLVAVATAGGGIQASAWTAQVLWGLERSLAGSFSSEVALVSAVSGGSVGALFYLDRFREGRLSEGDEVFAAATENNLDAIGWGLTYPDFWRLLGLPLLRGMDRGSALEDDWALVMRDPKATLKSWREAMLSGEKPLAVFNATLVQNGLRYLLSPLPLAEDAIYKSSDFSALYPRCDLRVRTAVRLSATFPYITPIARNEGGEPVFHVADGGYFDNFGVFTLLNFLDDRVLRDKPGRSSLAQDLGVERVLLLEIRAFPDVPEAPPPGRFSGWIMEALGPLLTLFSIRNSTQTARNVAEVRDLERLWDGRPLGEGRRLEVETFRLVFPAEFDRNVSKAFIRRGGYLPPLSWKLSRSQIAAIEAAWAYLERTDPEFKRLKELWRAWHPDEPERLA